MTILYAGSGLDSLLPSDATVGESITNGDIDGSFVRSGTSVSSSGTATATGWTDVQEVWVHLALYKSIVSNSDIFKLQNGGVDVFKLTRESSVLRTYYLSGLATWTQIGSDVAMTAGMLHHLDIRYKTGASGAVELYIDQTEKFATTGSYTYATDIDNIVFPASNVVSGIAVATENTIGWRVVQGYVSGTGSDTAWTGDYTGVDEATLSDVDFINSTAADQVETFTFTPVAALTGYTVRGVCVSARAKRDASGPQSLQLALRSSGTNYFSSSKTLGLGYTAVQNIWETNPATSADWLSSQIAALQVGVKSIA